MLSFAVYSRGKLATECDLSGAYLVGSDDVPLRADIAFHKGVITCKKRTAGPAGLTLRYNVPGVGFYLLETIRLQERDKPYVLQLELARARLMRIQQKLEDWGYLEAAGSESFGPGIVEARSALIRALQADSPAEAADRGGEALTLAVRASDALARLHADQSLAKRKQAGAFGRRTLGCVLREESPTDAVCKRLAEAFDIVSVPIIWRDIEPAEQKFQWAALDEWVEKLAKRSLGIRASSLLSFDEGSVPDWLFVWEHDFDAVRDMAYEHVRRVLNRYGQYVQVWDVISGIHANTCFAFSFEQLMELTRMTAALTKQVCPKGTAVVNITTPWGEYYARNQRSIPPLLYADMTVQSGVDFDAFGLEMRLGASRDGMFMRDMFQISSLLDVFVKLGKPLHVSAVQTPSERVGKRDDSRSDGGDASTARPSSEKAQAEWLRAFLDIALGKPIVESVCWYELCDQKDSLIPTGGLLTSKLAPKSAFGVWSEERAAVQASIKKASRGSAA